MPRLSFCESGRIAGPPLHSGSTALRETVKFTRRSRARVKAVVDIPQTRLEHVRVDLRRREIGVPEHHLDGAQIGAALEQMRRERMPQDVRTERAADAGATTVGS